MIILIEFVGDLIAGIICGILICACYIFEFFWGGVYNAHRTFTAASRKDDQWLEYK